MKTAEEYLNSKGFYNTNRLNNCFGEEITITDMLRDYATEAIKADRERVAANATIWVETPINGTEFKEASRNLGCQTDPFVEKITVFKESILNLAIELP